MARDTPILVFHEDDHFNPQLLSVGPFQGQSEGATIDLLYTHIQYLFQTAGRPVHTQITEMYAVFDWRKPSLSPHPKRRIRITPFNVLNILAVASESSPFSYLEFAVGLERHSSDTSSTPSLEEMTGSFPSLDELVSAGGEQASMLGGEEGMAQDQTDCHEEGGNAEMENHDSLKQQEASSYCGKLQSDLNIGEHSSLETHHDLPSKGTECLARLGDRCQDVQPAWDAPTPGKAQQALEQQSMPTSQGTLNPGHPNPP